MEAIAKRFDTTVYRIRRILQQENLSVKELRPSIPDLIRVNIDRWQAEEKSVKDAAAEIGVTSTAISNALKQTGHSLTKSKSKGGRPARPNTDFREIGN